jgi:hypothetical protein
MKEQVIEAPRESPESFAAPAWHQAVSQSLGRTFRLINKATKGRTRLGGSPNLFESFPVKPKGLHRKTYDRLKKEHDDANQQLPYWSAVCIRS